MADYFEEMGWRPLADGETVDHLSAMLQFLRDGGFLPDYPYADHNLPPPVAKDILENLPDFKIEKPDSCCMICLKEFTVGEMSKVLVCDHNFHKDCITIWLQKTSTCPLCRLEMRTDDENYERYKKAKKREKEREIDIENLHNSMFT